MNFPQDLVLNTIWFAKMIWFKNIILLILLHQIVFLQTVKQLTGSRTLSYPRLISSIDNLYWLTQNPGEWDDYHIETAVINVSSIIIILLTK
jgi:hypothetical protein